METHKLGPNGGLVYCMEYLQANLDWLEDQLTALDTHYIIFDCPGQVELYTHHTGFKAILDTIAKNLNCRLCSVHLVDAFYCWYVLKHNCSHSNLLYVFFSLLLTDLLQMFFSCTFLAASRPRSSQRCCW